MKTKQVIVIRKDLKMRRGKECAQVAHASMASILNESCVDSHGNTVLLTDIEMDHWLKGTFTKIVVTVNSEQELLDVHKNAQIAGLNCALIRDNGLTEFNGVRTYTTCAIGPNEVSKVDAITGHLPLY